MHIAEGFLPIEWCLIWFIISIVFIAVGIVQMKKVIDESPESKKIFTISGVLIFILSLLKLPSVTGSCSQALGNGLSGSLFGPAITSVIVTIVLILQAFLLGYGGLTTLGANIFSIGIVGPFVAFIVYYGLKRFDIPPYISMAITAFLSNIFTCITAAAQLGLVYGKFNAFLIIYAITQLPLAIIDTFITTIVFIVILELFKYSYIFDMELEDFLSLR